MGDPADPARPVVHRGGLQPRRAPVRHHRGRQDYPVVGAVWLTCPTLYTYRVAGLDGHGMDKPKTYALMSSAEPGWLGSRRSPSTVPTSSRSTGAQRERDATQGSSRL